MDPTEITAWLRDVVNTLPTSPGGPWVNAQMRGVDIKVMRSNGMAFISQQQAGVRREQMIHFTILDPDVDGKGPPVFQDKLVTSEGVYFVQGVSPQMGCWEVECKRSNRP
jgi:hypothetical protein